ncbi:hypothetical protein AMTRI_Chr02g258000 [Amborella trichopoda]
MQYLYFRDPHSMKHDTNQMQKGSQMRESVCTASSPQDIGKDLD